MSQYRGWTIGIVPWFISNQWRARVRIWPPEVRPEAHGGVNLTFDESAADEATIVQSALTLARRRIDGYQRSP